MRSQYKLRKSSSRESIDNNNIITENNNESKVKYNFNFRFNLSKGKSPNNIPLNRNSRNSSLNKCETEAQKEIYKNKIISKMRKYNANIKLIRQSSYSKFDNEEKEYINKLTKKNKEINQKIKMLSINYIKKKKERNSAQKNNNSVSSNIKRFDSPNNNKNKNTLTIGSESTSVTKKKKFEIKPYKSNKHFEIKEKINTEQNKENICTNNNLNLINKEIPFSSAGNKSKNNKIRTSFKYLVHQAYKNKALSKSFSRFYKSSRSKEKNDKKIIKNKIVKMNVIKNNLINSNNVSRNNLRTMNYYLTTSFENNSFFSKKNYIDDFELIFNTLQKIKILIKKIDNYEQIQEECYNFIQYYFNNLIYNKLTSFFSDMKIALYIKKEIISFFICYDISFNNTFYNQTGILLKTILSIIVSNYIIILYSIILKTNSLELKKYLSFLENEISINQIKSEGPILQILENNIQYINNYYKMIVDNIYKNNNILNNDTKLKFPTCLKYKELTTNNILKINVISSFFSEGFKCINEINCSFLDLQKFFYFFLNRNNKYIINNINTYEKKKEIINNSIKNVSITNFNDFNIKQRNQRVKYLLPKIKIGYEYSLVLDLDDTLIKFNQNISSVILRPGLKDFLHRMKKIYELILFTSAISDYVDPIVNFIEKEEKYFDFILYRKHLSFDEKGEGFKNLNLLNRNCKKIIIIDDSEKNFKLHKSNGICIKPFFGKDDNILNMLTQLLIKIRLDAEKSGDVRISLKQAKRDLIYKKIENNNK